MRRALLLCGAASAVCLLAACSNESLTAGATEPLRVYDALLQ